MALRNSAYSRGGYKAFAMPIAGADFSSLFPLIAISLRIRGKLGSTADRVESVGNLNFIIKDKCKFQFWLNQHAIRLSFRSVNQTPQSLWHR